MKLSACAAVLFLALIATPDSRGQNLAGGSAATLIARHNSVEVSRGGSWSSAQTGQALNVGDRLRTGEESGATVRISDGSVLQLDEFTTIEIKPPKGAGARETLGIPNGAVYFQGGVAAREVGFETPAANGAIRGTAFLLKVTLPSGQATVSMMDGAFQFSNTAASLVARVGEQAIAQPQTAPAKNPLSDLGSSGPWYLVIERDLPSPTSFKAAGSASALGGMGQAITQWQRFAPQLAGSATIVRRELARDIVRVAFRSVSGDCGMLGRILRSVIAADPEEASALTDLALQLAPQCADSFKPNQPPGGGGEEYGPGAPPPNNTFVPVTGGGGQGTVVAVCHNGRTIFLTPEAAQQQLANNKGDTLGPCQVTPTNNR